MATIMFINQVMMNQRFKLYYDQIIKNSEKIDAIYKEISKLSPHTTE